MKKLFDLTIIGSGMIGSYSLLNIIKKYSNYKICFISDNRNKISASAAAGAMLNVFGEIDYDKHMDNYQQRKIDIGIRAQDKWKNFIKNNLNYKKTYTANDTIIFKSRNATSLEKNCFKTIRKWNSKFNKEDKNLNKKIKYFKKNVSQINSPIDDLIGIPNEGAIDTNEFFKIFDKNIQNNKKIIINKTKVLKIEKNFNFYKIYCQDNIISSKKVIVAAGSDSINICSNLKSKIIPTYYGVGTAFVTKPKNKEFNILPKNTVLRSPNRGSTCGIHVVPRNDNTYYIGAGSFISKSKINSFGRIETINYLHRSLENELVGKTPYLEFIPVIGYRPISFDCKPLIGMLNNHPNIYVIGGTKRDGLTYAPIISDSIINWLENKSNYPLFEGWEPEREPISYGDRDYAIKSYVDNKIAGILEHNKFKKNKKKEIIKNLNYEAQIFHNKIIKTFKLNKDFGVHPEILNIF